MKCDIPAPLERLMWFHNKLGLEGIERGKLDQYQDIFVERKKEFAEKFYEYFCEIPETKLILDYKERQGHMRKAWMQWFESLFKKDFNENFLNYLWRSGLRHVENNIDQRFINLGFSFVRRYCQNIIGEEIPVADREQVMVAIDKMVDFCLLIETQAYIEGTSQCDLEVVKGISHQVRNPLTVIGGNILRLRKRVEPDSPVDKIYESILGENRRLEAMVTDVGVYSEMFEMAPEFSVASLESLISGALERLRASQPIERVKIDIELDDQYPLVQGVPEDLETMFYYLLQNSLEAADPEKPYMEISSRLTSSGISFIEIEIFNNGAPPSQEEMDNLFIPFYSSKPYGTGFGLPIAQLAARKSLGDLFLEPVPEKGTRVTVKLPIPATQPGRN